jgi:hypothetical protein
MGDTPSGEAVLATVDLGRAVQPGRRRAEDGGAADRGRPDQGRGGGGRPGRGVHAAVAAVRTAGGRVGGPGGPKARDAHGQRHQGRLAPGPVRRARVVGALRGGAVRGRHGDDLRHGGAVDRAADRGPRPAPPGQRPSLRRGADGQRVRGSTTGRAVGRRGDNGRLRCAHRTVGRRRRSPGHAAGPVHGRADGAEHAAGRHRRGPCVSWSGTRSCVPSRSRSACSTWPPAPRSQCSRCTRSAR